MDYRNELQVRSHTLTPGNDVGFLRVHKPWDISTARGSECLHRVWRENLLRHLFRECKCKCFEYFVIFSIKPFKSLSLFQINFRKGGTPVTLSRSRTKSCWRGPFKVQ